MTDQSAVEWLLDWMGQNQYFIGNDLLDAVYQAMQLEEEKLKERFDEGYDEGFRDGIKMGSSTSWTDGPIMVYGKHNIDPDQLNKK